MPAGFLSTIQIGIAGRLSLESAFAANNFASKLTSEDGSCRSRDFSGYAQHHCGHSDYTDLSYFTLVFKGNWFKRIAMQKPDKVAGFRRVGYRPSIVMKPIMVAFRLYKRSLRLRA